MNANTKIRFGGIRHGCGWLCLLSIVMACSLPLIGHAQSYYPDELGNTWFLRSTDGFDERVVTIKGPETINDQSLKIIEERTNDNVNQLFIKPEADGVKLFRSVVSVALLGDVTFNYSPAQTFLPIPIELGSTWTVRSETTVPLAGTVRSVNRAGVVAIEDVTVPAGTFRNCLKIEQNVTISLVIGVIESSNTMWLAPDVGLVKAIDSKGVIFELVRFDITLPTPPPPWDVNRDGIVDLMDLLRVASRFGEVIVAPMEENPDVNGDGAVNIFDLVEVGAHFGEGVRAAPGQRLDLAQQHMARRMIQQPHILERVQTALAEWRHRPPASANAGAALAALESWLLEADGYLSVGTHHRATPHGPKAQLLPNYPNPFNPETWIPYELALPADVRIEIYTSAGRLVRRLNVGQKGAGRYHQRQLAAYWDGRDEAGEPVASGVYPYVMRVVDSSGMHTYLRKMVITK